MEMSQQFAPSLFSTRVHNGSRTFFIDVKETKGSKPYLKISEYSVSKEGEKKKSYLNVFDNEINDFRNAIDEAAGFVDNQK